MRLIKISEADGPAQPAVAQTEPSAPLAAPYSLPTQPTRGPSAADTLAAALEPFAFLLGNWEAAPGAGGETGGFSFRSNVQGASSHGRTTRAIRRPRGSRRHDTMTSW
ncbi:MAG TPA: hypothetical protein VH583_14465 [Vicinamibacterales bacterium]